MTDKKLHLETCLILCRRVRCLSCSFKEESVRFKVIIFHRVGRNDFGLTRIRLGEKATDHEKAFFSSKERKLENYDYANAKFKFQI